MTKVHVERRIAAHAARPIAVRAELPIAEHAELVIAVIAEQATAAKLSGTASAVRITGALATIARPPRAAPLVRRGWRSS